MDVLDAQILFQVGHYSTSGVHGFYRKTRKMIPGLDSGVNELRGRLVRPNRTCFCYKMRRKTQGQDSGVNELLKRSGGKSFIPGWELFHFQGALLSFRGDICLMKTPGLDSGVDELVGVLDAKILFQVAHCSTLGVTFLQLRTQAGTQHPAVVRNWFINNYYIMNFQCNS